MRPTFLAVWLALVPLAAFAGGAPAAGAAEGVATPPAGDCAEPLARRVQAHYDGVRDLHAHFTQRTRSVALGAGAAQEVPAAGEVWFAKPGKMRWAYASPEPSLVVSDGQTLWIYDPAAGEVQELAVGEAYLSGAAIQFLLGAGQILETFRVAVADCAADPARLQLTPRAESTYERLDLEVDPASGAIAATTVRDLFGNETAVRFRSTRRNTDPDPGRFRFVPPAGVRVLKLR